MQIFCNLDAFFKLASLKLVGPFNFISDFISSQAKLDGDGDYVVESRFSTDLPEMETIMLYENGRFCYWRDTPEQTPSCLIHVSNSSNHFPEFTIVGDRNPFCAIQYLLLTKSNGSSEFEHFFPDNYVLDKYDHKYLQTLKKERAKQSVGMPFHGIGIKVEINGKGIGYRPICDDKNEYSKQNQIIRLIFFLLTRHLRPPEK